MSNYCGFCRQDPCVQLVGCPSRKANKMVGRLTNEPRYLVNQRIMSNPRTNELNEMLAYIDTLKNVAYAARELAADVTMSDRRANMKELNAALDAHYGRFRK